MNSMDKTTFLIADDHSMIRQGIEFLIEDLGIDFDVIHASNLQQVSEKVETNPIDVVIIDAHFPDGNSLSILPQIKVSKPEVKVLVFTGIEEKTNALKFLNAGANGFLSKLNEEEEIAKAIESILHKGEYFSEVTKELLLDSVRNPHAVNPLQQLSDRELEIANLYAKGLGNLEIANQLDIKQNTVSTMKKRIFDKLNVENLLELVDLMKSYQ